MKITDKDVLYNKAYKYGRHDICLEIAEFEENVRKYEETGLQLYKDKATGRYYHMILWEEIICRLRDEWDSISNASSLKQRIIDELGLPEPYKHSCYAHCKVCPIVERAGQCSDENSAYYKFSTALDRGDRDVAIKYAEVIVDAWTK